MYEETGIEVEVVKLVGVYSDPERDPRKTISALYIVKRVGGELRPGSDASEVRWFSLNSLPELAFDHKKLIADGVKELRS